MGNSGANGLSYETLEQLADPFIKDLHSVMLLSLTLPHY